MSVLASGFSNTVSDGSLLPAAGVALLVGVVGFLSPCVLPLVPGYLSYVAGLAGSQQDGMALKVRQRRMLAGAALFVLGFTSVFVAAGALFGTLSSQMAVHHVALEQVFGVITIAMGIAFLGKIPLLQREFKIHRLPRSGLLGAPLLGITFGLAWTPCLTPTLSAVLGMATSAGTAGRGTVLSIAYCIGLGVPFLLVALGLGWVTGALAVVRRHGQVVGQLGGAVLIVMGVLLLTGTWDQWMNWLRSEFSNAGVGAGL
ncbi:cytochrome c biogenesis protein CcdA [Jatrophihabitans telluris]|uniref:Cytochrome c biogenesis protein CcdA n=1 Tax=Jatrophihabitans telluris TaxID=2038343 RepID=A0ABY4R085_9ACTN|nr:cytochrome c biogenesis protein CcdA [Jatrophihabitans telluris]UQX88882.1 cytochrome c biogenesis protein CcdA [Jatrophihabitans telluris]